MRGLGDVRKCGDVRARGWCGARGRGARAIWERGYEEGAVIIEGLSVGTKKKQEKKTYLFLALRAREGGDGSKSSF